VSPPPPTRPPARFTPAAQPLALIYTAERTREHRLAIDVLRALWSSQGAWGGQAHSIAQALRRAAWPGITTGQVELALGALQGLGFVQVRRISPKGTPPPAPLWTRSEGT
jgi:hypothetical protein